MYSIPLICWLTSDTSGSGSVLFLLVLFVVTPSFAFLVACWTLCLENPRGSEWCCLLQSFLWHRPPVGTELSVHSGPEGLEAGGPCKLSLSSLQPPSPLTPGRSFPESGSGSLGCLPSWQVLKPTVCLLNTTRWLILSTQPVWAECWVRFLTSRLTHQACAGIFVSPAQGTVQSCVSQPSLLDLFSAFSSQSGLCSDAPREGAALSVSSSLTGLPFCLKSWIVAA